MWEKYEGAIHSTAASNPVNMAEEPISAAIRHKRTRRSKLIKVCMGIVFFIIFHSLLLLAIGSIIPIRKPKYRIQSVIIKDLNVSDDFHSPSFHVKLIVVITLKNSNFGAYKFEDSNLTFSYNGTTLGGRAVLPKSSVHIRSKKTTSIVVNLSSNSVPRNSNLSLDIASGMLPLNCRSQLRGDVEYVKVIKRYKSATLNCTLTINLLGKALQRLRCA